MSSTELGPFKEGDRASRGSFLIGIKEMPVQDIILINSQFYATQAENFSVKPVVDYLVRSNECNVMQSLYDSL